MPEQQQIVHAPILPVPNDYLLADNVEILLYAVNANFTDDGAGTDWLPAVVLLSDSNHVIARALLPDVQVVAGDDAEVSWFPGLKPGSASAVPSLTRNIQHAYPNIGQVVPSGVPTTITFGAGTIFDASAVPLNGPHTFPQTITGVADFEAQVSLIVEWPAGAYDRYIEIVEPSFFTSGTPIVWRERGSLTPDDDIQTLDAILDGLPSAPTTVEFNCFQASGVNKTIQTWLVAATIPYLNPPGINI